MRRSARLSVVGLLFLTAPAAGAQTFRREGAPPPPAIGLGTAVAAGDGEVYVARPGLVVGFPMPPAETGAIHVFRRGAQGAWTEAAAVTARDGAVGDGFGMALAVDGSWMAVGAPNVAEGRGAVYVFERDAAGRWTERAKLGGAAGDGLGSAVAVGGGVLLAGAPGHGEQRGAVVVYRRDPRSGAWTEHSRLTGSAAASGDRFGSSLALSGDRAAVGAPGQLGGAIFGPQAQIRAGAAFVFRRDAAGAWSEEARLAVADDSTARAFGTALLLGADELLASSPIAGGGAGAVFRFRLEGGRWRQAERLAAATPERPALFGMTLARAGADVLVGAPFAGQGAGAVHVLRLQGGSWRPVQTLTTEGIGLGVQLGGALAARGDLALAGAPGADFFMGKGVVFARDASSGQWREAGALVEKETPALAAVSGSEVQCAAGKASAFDCRDVDLVAFMPASALGAKRGIMINDMWGWTDPQTGREFAIVGRLDGTAFVEVTDPARPVYLGELPLHAGARPNLWRDMKVYRNHAFIVSDGAGPHGVQVFDLTQLRDVRNPPATFKETAHYDRIHSAHNIAIDEESGFAYTIGNSLGGETCGGGPHMIDIRDPRRPTFAGCWADTTTGLARTGYTHDAQCVVYKGPDTRYRGRQICFNASENALGIADVTDKKAPRRISSASYPNVAYAHQGWLSEDHRFFFLDDEGDELSGTVPKTRTLVFDITDLEDPVVAKEFLGTTPASDHNLYVHGRYMYQSNYVAGLRVIDVSDPRNPAEVGFFDTVPFGKDIPGFAGTWSNYPYFRSGVVAVTSMREGLFLVRYRPSRVVP
jgi:choice-of-anchor B domain-containing protein